MSQDNLPVYWDAEDLLHGREDLLYFLRASVSPVFGDDNRLLDFCNYRCDDDCEGTSLNSSQLKSSKLNV